MFELLTNTEMGEADRRTIAGGVSGATLMEAAGAAVARSVMARHPPGSKIAVVAGTGNNGGDGFVAARHLDQAGYRTCIYLVGRREALKGDAAWAAGQWRGPVAAGTSGLTASHVIIDALFGAGLDRPVAGDALAAIAAMNGAGAVIVAVDLPSGVNGTTGAVMGGAVNADRTVTFFRKKPGHLLLPGRNHCGPVEVAQIGIPDAVLGEIRPAAWENGPALWGGRIPLPDVAGHKYSRGHAVVVSGERTHTGAARLAAMAALRGGAGLVTLATPRNALDVNAAANLAVMVRGVDTAAELEAMLSDRRFSAVAVGPGAGVGGHTRQMVRAALAGSRGVVLDADALTSFADHAGDLFAALAKNGTAVLTPHAGEFHRLFATALEKDQATAAVKLTAARAAAAAAAAVVVYKGADTVIAAPDGRAVVNANAPPWLATAGTGDVLAGLTAALLAQGMPPFEAAAAAVWIHGDAATAAGPAMISEDLAPRFGEVYRRLFAMSNPVRSGVSPPG
ncbi:MAG: NAD(P)H-hydrate dehydratase [Bradyrhizobiaceae bacterium]|nr:NAD(P)H-hydrate dehydratase [Bradyrhizobiaceae bacterium]